LSQVDGIYDSVVQDILDHGIWDKDQQVRTKWADGTPAYTKSLISKQMVFDGTEVPILTKKKVAWKTAIHELLWFYVKRTSDVAYLREHGVKIWQEWTREDGTIGKAYGYQLGKLVRTGKQRELDDESIHYQTMNQVHQLVNGLMNNPASRRHIICLWNIDDLWDMALPPCVWNSQWLIKEGKLHGIVTIRSNDMALGNPFNVFQYYVLQRMLAQVTGWAVGILTFNINDAHVYERHVDGLTEQMGREAFAAPKLWINQYISSFDEFTIDDFILVNPSLTDFQVQDMDREEALTYAWYEHHDSIKMEVAI
jgi:thymidylate synthase